MSLGPALAPGLYPSSVTNPLLKYAPILWLRADRGVVGSPCSEWDDWQYPGRTAPLFNFAQSDASRRPAVAGSSLVFDGYNDCLSNETGLPVGGDTERAFCFTLSLPLNTQVNSIVSEGQEPLTFITANGSASPKAWSLYSNALTHATFNGSSTGVHSLVMLLKGVSGALTVRKCYLNGIELPGGTPSRDQTVTWSLRQIGVVGIYNYLAGAIYEILIAPTVSTGIVAEYHAWAQTMWGVA